jgi:hypothetical protein
LRHVQQKQNASNLGKNAKLVQELWQVLSRQRVVKGPVPGIEPDLHPSGHQDHCDHGKAEQ